MLGNAYSLPVNDGEADAGFSIAVWFHLADLDRASYELSRVLKKGGAFRIVTTNPESYGAWENMYESCVETGKLLVGKVYTPVLPLSRNTLYRHTQNEVLDALTKHGLVVESVSALGILPAYPNSPLFINIGGKKE